MSFTGWVEILFIALLAFVIIGPKDLPKILFMLGRFMQTLRHLSKEFMSEFESIYEEDTFRSNKNKTQKTKYLNKIESK